MERNMGLKLKNNYLHRAILMACVTLTTVGCIDSVDQPVQENFEPKINSIDAQTLVALTNYTYTVAASDANSEDIVTLSAIDLPAWLTFDAATGLLTGMPEKDDTGEHTVTITASDGELETSATYTITVSTALTGSQWEMLWSDEFEGSTLNADNWTIETGDGSQYGIIGWGNNELEWYSADNISLAEGNLVITAKKEPSNGYSYTSGRMRSDTKVEVKYGRIEARVKTPVGQGLWSAFWMLPTDSEYGGWASGGEIDIMEVLNVGTGNEDQTLGTLHYGMAWPLNVQTGGKAEIIDVDEFHVYAIEWEQNEMRWYIDDYHYATVNSDTWWSYYYGGLDTGYVSTPAAPFDQEFHLLFNLAVGGTLPGSPNENTVFDAQMMVDYVRVYQCNSGEASGVGCANNINSTVEAPAADAVYTANYPLFNADGVSLLSWEIAGETVTRELKAAVAWDNGGIIVEEVVGEGDHTNVLDINTNSMGNVAISATDGEAIALFGMGNNPNSWELAAGELKFDLYINSALTPEDSSITFKMDSGYPALGYKTLAVADLPKDTWTTVSIKVNDLLANSGDQPLDTSAVMNLFIVEFSAAAHIQLDNIALICGHRAVDACGITPPSIEIAAEVVDVFTDAVNDTIWTNGMRAWDPTAGSDYADGTSDNHINWALVDTGEEGHDTVVEVNFKADDTSSGVFFFQSAQSVDMSALDAGNLIFDIKVTDYGTNTKGMAYKVDCVYPCSTNDQVLGVVGDNVWETIIIPVSTLKVLGLDTTKVNAPLALLPVDGDQQGVTFQVDNVRWEKAGTEPGPDPDPVAEEILYDDTLATGLVFNSYNPDSAISFSEVSEAGRGTILEVTKTGANGNVYFEASTAYDLTGRLSGDELVFDVNVTSTDANVTLLVKFDSGWPNVSDHSVTILTLGEWSEVRINIADMLTSGNSLAAGTANASEVNNIFVIEPQGIMTVKFDNIRLTSPE